MTRDQQALKDMGAVSFFNPNTNIYDKSMAMDAQIAMNTVTNGGIPAFLTNSFDKRAIDVLFTPMQAATIAGGETFFGNPTDVSLQFLVIESTGTVNSYGDFNNNGMSGINANYPTREIFRAQTLVEWGEFELLNESLAGIDGLSRRSIASALTLNKFQNKSYFYGIAGLKIYGMLNDPSLTAALTPTSSWASAAPEVIYDDIRRTIVKVITQSNGLVDMSTSFKIALSPNLSGYLNKANIYGLTAMKLLKDNFSVEVVVAAEYSPSLSPGGNELMQVYADGFDGMETVSVGGTERLRTHRLVLDTSSARQKFSKTTYGAVIKRPFLIAQMAGM